MESILTSVRLYLTWGGMGTQFKNEYFQSDFFIFGLGFIVFLGPEWGVIASNTPFFDAEIIP